MFIEADRRYTIPSDEAISKNDTVPLKVWEWPLEEFEFVYGLSKTHPHGKYVLGIVPWAPMNVGASAVGGFYELLGVEGEGGVERKRMLKGFRYLVQDKPSGTIGEVKFRESVVWVWEMGWWLKLGSIPGVVDCGNWKRLLRLSKRFLKTQRVLVALGLLSLVSSPALIPTITTIRLLSFD